MRGYNHIWSFVEGKLSINFRQLFLIVCFAFFMFPIVGGTFSINYSFVLMPFIFLVCNGRLHKPDTVYLAVLTVYILIYAIAVIYQVEMLPEILRRTGSFLLFMSMFAFLFVDIDGEAVDAFKAAAILISLGTALKAILFFFVLGGNRLDFAAKDAVGSMHFGYMYIIAFWLLYLSKPQGSLSNLIKMGCIFIILIGTALTFARASIVALAASFLLFLLISLPRVSLRRLARIFISFGIGIGAGIYILMVYFPVILDFFNVRLIQLLLNSTELQNRLAHSGSSEGERLVMWSNIIEYVSNNPITGAGYFGPWIIQARAYLASAHNQYLDILFRTGFLGFFVYLGLLCSISNYLWRAERALFWGLVGTMFFGFFAETFKEGQGAFIFSFFLGMLSQSDRLERESFRLLLPSASIQEN